MMPKPLTKPGVLRESWRPNNIAQLRAKKQQLAVRLTFAGILCGLVITALYLIFAPLFHPTTRLFFVTAGASHPSTSTPIPFFQEDALRFLTSTGGLSPAQAASHLLFMESPEAFHNALERVASTITSSSDVAIVYLAAHPLLVNQQPYLRCDNFDPERPLEGAVACEELFKQLSQVTTGHVILLLDTGNSNDEQSLFLDDSLLFDRLEHFVTDHASPNYTIILSHSPAEQSYRSTSLQCSVFAFTASLGLAGLADLDNDRRISMSEFIRFVSGATHAIVQKESGGAATQHPRMLLGQDESADRFSGLVIGSAPRKSAIKLAQQYDITFDGASPAVSPPTAAPTVATTDASQPKEEEQTFRSSLNDYVARQVDDVTEDLHNELILLTITLPKPLAKGLSLSVNKAQKIADKSNAQSTSSTDNPEQPSQSDQASAQTEDASSQTRTDEPAGGEITAPGFPDLSALPTLDALGLVRLAWAITAYFENEDTGRPRPVDLAPVPWMHWRSRLHAIEERIRTGAMIDERQTRLELTSEILGGYQLAHGHQATIGSCMMKVSQEIVPLPIPLSAIGSFGAAKNLNQFGLITLPPEITAALDDFDRCLASDTREALDKWLTESSTNETNHFVEVHYARMLLSDPVISWPVAQSLLKARRDLDRCSSHPLLNQSALGHVLTLAHRNWFHAARLALDHIGDWSARSTLALAEAQSALAEVERQLRIFSEAWQWRNQVLIDIPALMAWLEIDTQQLSSANMAASDSGQSMLKELPLLIDELATLSAAFSSRETATTDAMETLLRRAQNRYANIRRSWMLEFEALQARNSESKTMMASDAWIVDALLSSTLVNGSERDQLLQWRLKTAVLPELTPTSAAGAPLTFAQSTATARARGALLSKLARMGDLKLPEIEEPWALSDAFSQTRVLIPSLIASSAGQETEVRSQALRRADLLQRLMWQSTKLAEDSRMLNRELWRTEFAKSFRLERQSSSWILEDALQEEVQFWPDLQLRLAQLESILSGQNVSALGTRNQIAGYGPSSLSLVTSPEASGRIVWKNSGPDVGNIWLVVDYDHDNLELIADTTLPYYTARQLPALLQDALSTSEQQLVSQFTSSDRDLLANNPAAEQARSQIETIRRSALYPVRPLAGWIEPSAGLAAGQTLSIPFKIRRIGNGVGASKIVWKLISEKEYVRCEVPIDRADSKQLKLVTEGPTENWSENADGLVLHPWPNRTTEFRIGLVNEGNARTVNVELYRLLNRGEVALPNGFVDAAVSREILNRLGNVEPLSSIPEVSLPESKIPYWLTLQADKAAAPATKPDEPPALPSIRYGVVAVMTDKDSGEKLWRKIDFRVRHPRSYVEPRITYDAISERIVIRLQPAPGQIVPVNGITVHGQCLSSLPSGMERRLDGILTSTGSLELVCQVPPRPGRKVTMALDIDGFPRAFVFDVPCWDTQSDVPLVMDAQRLSITQPESGLLIPGTKEQQKVSLQVDAFPGAFSNDRDVIEVGWDLDRDREFAGESTTKIYSDRQVNVDLLQMKGDRLVVKARVDDLEVIIPAPPLRAANINLLARMSSAGETHWSQAIDVTADDQAPKITGSELMPDVVIKQGEDLNVTVGAEDKGLSGVALVQLQVDRKLNGLWDPAGAAIECARTAEGSWNGALPTADLIPGRINVMIRATDRAGNVSPISKTHFELLSVEQWQARQASAGVEVTGSISYSGGPLGGARIALENAKGEIVYQTKANNQGIFQFTKVAVGKYKLVGTGVAKNRPRRSESEVEVKQLSSAPLRLQLQAK